jgi:hypothetical protein
MCTAVRYSWLRPRISPPSPRIWTCITRALLVSKDRRHLFVTPCIVRSPIPFILVFLLSVQQVNLFFQASRLSVDARPQNNTAAKKTLYFFFPFCSKVNRLFFENFLQNCNPRGLLGIKLSVSSLSVPLLSLFIHFRDPGGLKHDKIYDFWHG